MSDKRRLERVNVPRPCPVSWESMSGTEKARACAECRRQVYNLSAMSRSEADDLLGRGGERLCITYSRGPDGKIITADRLPAYAPPRRPLASLSVAALAAFIGISHPAAALGARTPAAPADRGDRAAAPRNRAEVKPGGSLSGTVFDPNQAVIYGAVVTARNDSTGEEFTAQSGEEGTYWLPLPKGGYTVRVSSLGFMVYMVTGVKVGSGSRLKLDATLQPAFVGEYVPVRFEEPRSTFSKVLTAPFRALKRLFGR